jgi:hypothetical protein
MSKKSNHLLNLDKTTNMNTDTNYPYVEMDYSKRLEDQPDRIFEILKYYQDNPKRRSLSGINECLYFNEELQTCCAIGQMIPNEMSTVFTKSDSNEAGIRALKKRVTDQNFLKWVDENESLLIRLQTLHDTFNMWDEIGMTEKGYEYLKTVFGSILTVKQLNYFKPNV